jgi:enoyl-CoA hydratase/carnithine racemase
MSEDRESEVVTEAKVRLIDLPYGAGQCALITVDNGRDHTRPSTFGPLGLASLDAALDQVANTPGLSAVAITGKPFIFAVGADLSQVSNVGDETTVRAFAELGHRVFGRIADLGLPSFAFINGAAMGGGFELALNCDYRTISVICGSRITPGSLFGIDPRMGRRLAGAKPHRSTEGNSGDRAQLRWRRTSS